MTWDDALEQLSAQGHAHADKFRELCTRDADPTQRDAYRRAVVRLATTGLDAPTPLPVDYGTDGPGPCRGCGHHAPTSLPERSP